MASVASEKGDLEGRDENQRYVAKISIIPYQPPPPRHCLVLRRRTIGIKSQHSLDFGKPSNKPSPVTWKDAHPAQHALVVGRTSDVPFDSFILHHPIGLGKNGKNTDRLAAGPAAESPNQDAEHALPQSAQIPFIISKSREKTGLAAMGTVRRWTDASMESLGYIRFGINRQCPQLLHA